MYPLEENISVARVTRGFLGCGGLYFAEKVGLNEFVIIFRDLKGARIACGVRAIDHHPVEVCCKLTQKKQQPTTRTIPSCCPHKDVAVLS